MESRVEWYIYIFLFEWMIDYFSKEAKLVAVLSPV